MLNCGHGRVGHFWTSRLSEGGGCRKVGGEGREKVGKCGGKSEKLAKKNGCGIMSTYR